jgi:hypothetical protein
MKRKCVREVAGCVLCTSAGVQCFFSELDDVPKKKKQFEEMTTWLSVCLNGTVPSNPSSGSGSQEVTPNTKSNIEDAGLIQVSDSSKTAAGRQLVDAYFRHIHRSYPFINRSEIIREVDSMITLSEGFENMSRKLYLVMAIGCTTLRRVGQVSDDICAKFKVSDHFILQDCLSRNDIESLEELLLLCLYYFFDPGGLSPWIITGILVRQTMAFGLARQLSDNQDSTLVRIETRHRLFWSIYTLDRIVSTSTGLPLGLLDPNMKVPLPGISLEEYASPERAYFAVTLQVNRHIIDLRQIEGLILERIHFVNPLNIMYQDRRAIIADLRTKIEDWYTQGCLINPCEKDQIPFHDTIPWLNCRYQNLLFLLYMPSALNHSVSLEHLQILRSATARYIQLSTVLFQQRHLPLNWVTLCRFVAICPMLLYCHVRGGGDPVGFSIKEAAISCAKILEAFNEAWDNAKLAASVFRLLEGISVPPLASGNGVLSSDKTEVNVVIGEMRSMIKQTLGSSSIYSGIVDAVVDIISDQGDDHLAGTWGIGVPATNNLLARGTWVDDATLWEFAVDLS